MAGIFGDAQFINVTKQVQASVVQRFVNEESVVFGMISKRPTWPGDPLHEVKWKISQGGGGGSTFAGARQNAQYGTYEKPVIPQTTRYQFGRIDHKTAKATKTKEGSALALAEEAIRDAWEGWALRNSHLIWSDLGCSLARIKTDLGGGVYELYDKRSTIYFTQNMTIQAHSSDGNSGGVPYAGSAKVIGVNQSAGTITLDNGAAINPGTGLAADDYVFAYDTFGQGLIGIQEWIPPTVPGPSDNFYGVNRSFWPERMAGSRAVATESILAATERFCGQIEQVGGKPRVLVVNAERFSDIKLELQATAEINVTVRNTSVPNGPTWSFKAPIFQGPRGPMPIVPDRYAPYRYLWFLNPDSWYFKSLDKWPHYSNENGGYLHPLEGDDASRFVLRGWGQLACERPKDNGVLDLGA